ncbi:hypothetical protein H2248_001180 [Termitomyces sp. 'cryptogamus']|nr:hypothetical protein H2248_001180 [Termitomyces sp. 'cryptogamus']
MLQDIWWSNTIFFLSVHVAAIVGALYWPPQLVPRATLILCFIIWQLGTYGITLGYHRLYSHRAFRASFGVRVILAAMGSSAFQGSIKRFTDDPVHDPYAATRGLFYSHIGWIFFKPNYERLETVDREDLVSDPGVLIQGNARKYLLNTHQVVRFQHAYYVPIAIICGFVIPTVVGIAWDDPLGSLIWGGLISKLAIWHCTFLVNSLAHWNGLQPYSDEDTSRGNLVGVTVFSKPKTPDMWHSN